MKKTKWSKWADLAVPAAIFFVPIVLLAVTFANTGRF